jgi:transposase
MPRSRKYPFELVERGVRMVQQSGRPIAHVARDLGINGGVLRKRVRQAEADRDEPPGVLTMSERAERRRQV